MPIGDVYEVQTGSVTDIYYLDVGLYDIPEYGAIYIVDAERPALIDTGIGTRYQIVLDALETVGIGREDLELIAPTHVHLDHAGGTGFLTAECPNAEVVCYERGVRHLVDPSRLWAGTKRAVGEQIKYYTEPEPVPEERIRSVADGDVVDLGDHALKVHHAPGHAPHQAVFHDPAIDATFVADAAGIYVPAIDTVEPTTPPPNFDLERSLKDVDLLQALEPETLLYSHYGPAPAEHRLTEYARVLTNWAETVEEIHGQLADDEAIIDQLVAEAETAEVWGAEKARAETALNVRGVLRYLDTRNQ